MGQIKNIKLHIVTDINVETEVAIKVGVATSVTSVVPTAPDVVPRTKPSRSSSSGTSWRLLQCEICQKPVCMMDMHFPSCTPNLLTVSVAPFTQRLLGIVPVKTVRSGLHHHDLDSDHARTIRSPVDLEDQVDHDLVGLEVLELEVHQDLHPVVGSVELLLLLLLLLQVHELINKCLHDCIVHVMR